MVISTLQVAIRVYNILKGLRKVVNSRGNVYLLLIVCHIISHLQKTLWKCSTIPTGLKATICSITMIKRNTFGKISGYKNTSNCKKKKKLTSELLKFPLERITLLPPFQKEESTHTLILLTNPSAIEQSYVRSCINQQLCVVLWNQALIQE